MSRARREPVVEPGSLVRLVVDDRCTVDGRDTGPVARGRPSGGVQPGTEWCRCGRGVGRGSGPAERSVDDAGVGVGPDPPATPSAGREVTVGPGGRVGSARSATAMVTTELPGVGAAAADANPAARLFDEPSGATLIGAVVVVVAVVAVVVVVAGPPAWFR